MRIVHKSISCLPRTFPIFLFGPVCWSETWLKLTDFVREKHYSGRLMNSILWEQPAGWSGFVRPANNAFVSTIFVFFCQERTTPRTIYIYPTGSIHAARDIWELFKTLILSFSENIWFSTLCVPTNQALCSYYPLLDECLCIDVGTWISLIGSCRSFITWPLKEIK